MLNSEAILAWVSDIPETCTLPPQTPSIEVSQESRKRKFSSQQEEKQQHLASPPTSQSTMDVTPRKRLRENDEIIHEEDVDATPRAFTASAPSLPRSNSRSTSRSASEHSRTSSRSGSPKKQAMGLRVDDRGLEFRQLNIEAGPGVAETLLEILAEIGRGHDILPHEWRERILGDRSPNDRESRLWRYSFKPAGVPDELPGRIPLLEEIELLAALAKECYERGYDEPGWNSEVHQEMLKAIFREPGKMKSGLFNFTNCTTARPDRSYLPRQTPAKMVDLCIYADVEENEDWSSHLQLLTNRVSTLSVNHTDFRPLQLRPIVLSIETKRPGTEFDKAQLQIGVWQAAQWKFLKSAITSALRAARPPAAAEGPTSSSAEEMELVARADAALDQLGFIPGVIIQGHKWLFVLSTRKGQKTILWTERQFGSTQSVLEVYQIVAGLRELAAWSRDVYLPWFRKHVLGV